jgi:hypothetical protein
VSVWADGQLLIALKLREVLELGGERPLNLALQSGARVEVRLESEWPTDAGELALEIS